MGEGNDGGGNGKGMRLLIVGDAPDKPTGFGVVVANLAKRWRAHFEGLDVWGINHYGWPHELDYVDHLYPAHGEKGESWTSPEVLQYRFLPRLHLGRYTHVWMIQDSFNLVLHGLAHALQEMKQVLAEEKRPAMKLLYYFPVDAPWEPEWTDIVRAVDVAVAYTEQGRKEVSAKVCQRIGDIRSGKMKGRNGKACFNDGLAMTAPEVKVIPHGVDTTQYYPLANRAEARATLFPAGFVKETDLLMVNVAKNQPRKDPGMSLQVLAQLKELGVPAKLVMHMPRMDDGIDLEMIGRQLGLQHGVDWKHNTELFVSNHGQVGEDYLNRLYNAADLFLTTTLGEGWGLPITEAMAAGCPVAAPEHTACEEIIHKAVSFGMKNCFFLPMQRGGQVQRLDNSRVRYPVDPCAAAQELAARWKAGVFRAENREGMPEKMKEWLSWDRIAGEWMGLMRGGE